MNRVSVVIEEQKFLPIGTICSVKGKNKKIMITGFYSVEYAGKVKMFDYSGCEYPEGLLSSNKNHSFNHEDVMSIEHVGYESEEHRVLNNLMLNQNGAYDESQETNEFLSNIQFDENGVVVFASFTKSKTEEPVLHTIAETSEKKVSNPFVNNYKEKREEKSSNDDQQWPIFKSIQFDENGMVISAELSEEPVIEQTEDKQPTLKFDENGIVIESGQ